MADTKYAGTRYRRDNANAADMAVYMRQISERLGVDKSTVSRTVKRGEARLRKILRYGGAEFLGAGHEGGEP